MMNIFTERGWRLLGCLFALGFGIGAAFVIFAVVTIYHIGLYDAILMAGQVWVTFIGGAWILSKIWRIARHYLFVGRL